MQHETRDASHRYANGVRDANRCVNVEPIHRSQYACAGARAGIRPHRDRVVEARAFPVDPVERALLDKGEDMILVLAKAAGCSWTTARELLLMHVAERNLQPDDLARACDRYDKLTREAARDVIGFYGLRTRLRAPAGALSQTP